MTVHTIEWNVYPQNSIENYKNPENGLLLAQEENVENVIKLNGKEIYSTDTSNEDPFTIVSTVQETIAILGDDYELYTFVTWI